MSSPNSNNLEWNPAPGARLPLTNNGTVLTSKASFGKGTLDDPRILYISKGHRNFEGADLNEFNEFARQQCKALGFTHIWIR
ncbi:hypothetical protein ANO14919_017260 [Xylariales sp. No.14919]|nr:hypothetical protein ANO14919_017260 [Xylariales sp. No.14919]